MCTWKKQQLEEDQLQAAIDAEGQTSGQAAAAAGQQPITTAQPTQQNQYDENGTLIPLNDPNGGGGDGTTTTPIPPGDTAIPIGKNETAVKDPGSVTEQANATADKTITDLTGQSNSALDTIANLTTSLTGQIAQSQNDLAKSQAALMEQMSKTAAESSTQMAKALADLANSQNGQPLKKPNYARALAKNRELNSGGLSSTMVTGPGGVQGGGSLGMTSILGA